MGTEFEEQVVYRGLVPETPPGAEALRTVGWLWRLWRWARGAEARIAAIEEQVALIESRIVELGAEVEEE